MNALTPTEAPTLTRGLPAMHPGEILKDQVLPALAADGIPRSKVAEHLGISRQALYDLMDARMPVSAELALKLGKLLRTSPELWLNLQREWDLDRAREKVTTADLARIPTLVAERA